MKSLVLPCLVALAACSSLSDLDNVDVEVTGQALVPAGTVLDQILGDLSFGGFSNFDIDTSAEFENQGYTKDQIDRIRITSFVLRISDPAGSDFDFLDSIEFRIVADGSPEERLAGLDEVPVGQDTLTLDLVTDLELRPYVVAPSFTLRTVASGNQPDVDTTIDATAVFDVDVDVSGNL